MGGEIAEWVKHWPLSLVTRVHFWSSHGGRFQTSFDRFLTDLYTYAMASTCPYICTHINKLMFTNFKEVEIMSVMHLMQNGGIPDQLRNCHS